MKKTTTLFLAFLVLSFITVSKASVIYTDVNPDIVNTGNSTLDIDVNNDLTPDFRITGAQAGNFSFDIVQAGQIGTNNFVLSDGSGNASALAINTMIGSSSTTWYQMNNTNLQMMIVTNSVGSGVWSGAIDKYLGLQFIVTSNTYYGWARFTFDVNTNMYTFKDYAYESNANTSILAGNMTTGINNFNLIENSVSTFPNPVRNSLTVNFTTENSSVNIQLLSLTGEVVYNSISENNTSGFYQKNIDVSDLAKGIYFVKISTGNGTLAKKIIIE